MILNYQELHIIILSLMDSIISNCVLYNERTARTNTNEYNTLDEYLKNHSKYKMFLKLNAEVRHDFNQELLEKLNNKYNEIKKPS